MRKETSTSEIAFYIVKVIDKGNRHDTIYSEISDELSDFKNDIIQRRGTVQRMSEGDTFRETSHNRPDRQQQSNDRRVSK